MLERWTSCDPPKDARALGKRHTAVLRRAAQLAVRRHGGRRQRQRNSVLAAADLSVHQFTGIDGHRRLRALFIALPKAQTADDFAALLPWRIDLTAA